ncbi:MAG: phosphopentomutase [Clostridiales bacterium]|nr:phosphopentomutase [Clostridiales bacterium]
MKRAVIIVLDSVGVGAAANLAPQDNPNANTLAHVVEAANLRLPELQYLGLGNILPLDSVPPTKQPLAAWGRMAPLSHGKDTTSGHWELAGLVLDKPMPTYPNGFPPEIMEAFVTATGRAVIGNKVASGTTIIAELGEEHMRTGNLIVYTSADSVFQIAAHEQVVPLMELYDACRMARAILQGPHSVGRVIARPFVGIPGNFTRTENRRDYSLLPPAGGLLWQLRHQQLPVVSIGKIIDIFAGQDISASLEAHNNQEAMSALLHAMDDTDNGLIFANLVDFDMLYGHRNNAAGYARALAEFDAFIPSLAERLREEDILIITADHGNDPTTAGTDHDRENVPLLVWGPRVKPLDLGLRATFADLGATVAEYLNAPPLPAGCSFLRMII